MIRPRKSGGISHVGGIQVCGDGVLVLQDYLLRPPGPSVFSPDRMDAVQSPVPPSVPTPAALEDGQESGAVVAVHPAIQQWVGEGGAHGDHVEDGVEEAEVAHVQHRAVDVRGQLEGMEGQPADGEHHHHGHQHLGGLATPSVPLRDGVAVAAVLRRTDVASQL